MAGNSGASVGRADVAEDSIGEGLQQLIVALSDPTRAAIIGELGHARELTPTQLARRLGLTPNNVYHHIRVLRGMGLLEEPRAVPGPTYVEKYYRMKPLLLTATTDPNWVDRTQVTMTPEQRQAFFVGHLLQMAALLRRAAQRYAALDPADFERLRDQAIIMSSVNDASRTRLVHRLKAWRDELTDEYERMPPGASDAGPETNLLIMAGLPNFWDEE